MSFPPKPMSPSASASSAGGKNCEGGRMGMGGGPGTIFCSLRRPANRFSLREFTGIFRRPFLSCVPDIWIADFAAFRNSPPTVWYPPARCKPRILLVTSSMEYIPSPPRSKRSRYRRYQALRQIIFPKVLKADAKPVDNVSFQFVGPLFAFPAGILLGRCLALQQTAERLDGLAMLADGIVRPGQMP